jgi:hypothetical protein
MAERLHWKDADERGRYAEITVVRVDGKKLTEEIVAEAEKMKAEMDEDCRPIQPKPTPWTWSQHHSLHGTSSFGRGRRDYSRPYSSF